MSYVCELFYLGCAIGMIWSGVGCGHVPSTAIFWIVCSTVGPGMVFTFLFMHFSIVLNAPVNTDIIFKVTPRILNTSTSRSCILIVSPLLF